jgi:membrane protein EpsK
MTGTEALESPVDGTAPPPVALGLGRVRGRFLMNIASNGVYIGVSTLANLWLTPFLIGHLGIAAFGMIPLVTTITSYMSVLTTALSTALGRFLVLDLERRDVGAANSTFNTAFFGLIGIVLGLIPLALGVSLAFPTLFRVPPGWEADAGWLFLLVALAAFVTVIASSFHVSPFLYSQFVKSNTVNLLGLLARLGLIAVLFSLLPGRLWYAGSATLIAALVSLAGFVLLWRKLTPELRIRITAFDRSRLRALTGMGGWVTVNTLGGMLLARTDLLVVNAFFGAALTGGYGSVAQFTILMEHMADAAATVLRPIILVKYAQQDLMGLQRLASQSVKLLGLALALPAGLLCGFSRPLLSIWLGPGYQYLSVLLVILVSHLSLNLSARPLLYAQTAYNRIRWPGIATLLSGGASLALGVLAGMWGGWGAAGVALAVAVAWTAKNTLYMPIYTAHIMKLPWWSFLPAFVPILTATLGAGLAAYGLTIMRMPRDWFTLALEATLVSVVYAAVTWVIVLNRADRQLLRDLLTTRKVPGTRNSVTGGPRRK